jgi:phospholipase C
VPVPVFVMEEFEPLDPPHEWDECHQQFNLGENNGFVFENEKKHPGFGAQVMGYHIREHIPVLYGLADNFTLCERWFSLGDGADLAEPLLHARVHSGTAGKTNFPEPFLKTLWHRCDDAGITAGCYFSDVPWVAGAFPLVPTVWGKLGDNVDGFNLNDMTNPNTLTRFFDDCRPGTCRTSRSSTPASPRTTTTRRTTSSSGRSSSARSTRRWPRARPGRRPCSSSPTTSTAASTTTSRRRRPSTSDPEFKQLGFRVPSLVIGPTVRRGCVNDLQFEHCSIGATLMKRFGIAPLNERMAAGRPVVVHPPRLHRRSAARSAGAADRRSISDILAGVGHTTSQEELFLAAGVTSTRRTARSGPTRMPCSSGRKSWASPVCAVKRAGAAVLYARAVCSVRPVAYVVLARKYRPQRFADLVGQEHVTRTLANAIAHNRVHHAYLFCGARGLGKTTAARLLAKCLVCVKGRRSTRATSATSASRSPRVARST